MMHEQIALNGAPVVGFGGSVEDEKKFYGTMIGVPLLGIIAGAAGGALLGRKKSGAVAAVGAVAGGIAGGAGGIVLAELILRATTPAALPSKYVPPPENDLPALPAPPSAPAQPTPTPPTTPSQPQSQPQSSAPTWKRIQVNELVGLKSGQQLAISVAIPGFAPFQGDIAQTQAQLLALTAAPASLPIKNYIQYPPGSELPTIWPSDDNLGPNAFRMIGDVVANAPPEAALLKAPLPSEGTIEMWVRDAPRQIVMRA